MKQTNATEEDYADSKSLYESRLNLPNHHPKKWYNFGDWLEYYNMLDVEPLVEAICNQFDKFRTYFNIEPIVYLSLPAIAEQAMWANFDQRCSYVYSFSSSVSKSNLNELIRSDGLVGGLVNLFHRHVSCNENGPETARFINGEKVTSILSLDFNSLYLYSQDQQLPTTPGLEWILRSDNKKFNKISLKKGVSFVSLQWLYYLQETDICVDKNGQRQQIHHGYHHGEVCCECLKFEHECYHQKAVDGYCNVDGEHIFFEFLGCHFHPGCECTSKVKANDGRREEVYETKKRIMKSKGRLIEMRECKWNQRDLSTQIQTAMGNILFTDDESTLLNAIKHDKVYGFAVCCVTTPTQLLESYNLLFPWIIKHYTITELSSFMRGQTSKKEFKTLIQSYNGTDVLLLSTTIKFYMDIGLKVTNVKKFIQYVPGQLYI